MKLPFCLFSFSIGLKAEWGFSFFRFFFFYKLFIQEISSSLVYWLIMKNEISVLFYRSIGPVWGSQPQDMVNNRVVFYSQKEIKAAKRSEFFSHLSVSELFECKQDRSFTIANLSKWNLSGCWILWQVKRGLFLSITNEPQTISKGHNVSKILIPLLCMSYWFSGLLQPFDKH